LKIQTKKSIGQINVFGYNKSQQEFILVSAECLQLMHCFYCTLAALVASHNINRGFISFSVVF